MVATTPPGPAPSPQRTAPQRTAATRFRVAPAPRQRSPLLLVVAVLVILTSAASGAVLYLRVGSRVEVLAVARTVPLGQRIAPADLRRARISADGGVHAVPVGDAGQVIGKTATTTLLPGMLLAPEALAPAAAPAAGQAIIGLELTGAQLPLPADRLAPGARVQLVRTPPREAPAAAPGPNQLATDTILTDHAEVYTVQPSADGASVHVAVLVDQDAAPALLGLAAAGQVGMAILPAGGA